MLCVHGGHLLVGRELSAPRGGKLCLELGALARCELGWRLRQCASALQHFDRDEVLLVRGQCAHGVESLLQAFRDVIRGSPSGVRITQVIGHHRLA